MTEVRAVIITLAVIVSALAEEGSLVPSNQNRFLFQRITDYKLLSGTNFTWHNTSVDDCASLCVTYDRFDCKAFDYVNLERTCVLYPVSDGDPSEVLVNSTYLSHYMLVADQKVSVIHNRSLVVHSSQYLNAQFVAATEVDCLRLCLKVDTFRCQSYDFSPDNQICIVHSASVRSPTSRLVPSDGTDHFQTTYLKSFRQLPHHSLRTSAGSRYLGVTTVEECARRCYRERKFTCLSFTYNDDDDVCTVSQHSSIEEDRGRYLVGDEINKNYYERIPDGALSQFVNYGIGALGEVRSDIYRRQIYNENLESCAKVCLKERNFACRTIDYNPVKHVCSLSDISAAAREGLRRPSGKERMNVIHFERIGRWLSYFHVTPYALIPGNNRRDIRRITPDSCARNCLYEEEFICRSFEYVIADAKCMLSDVTSLDAGSLYVQPLVQIHHYEMQPILACGGDYSELTGNFASPGWPRDYDHHLNCTWRIRGQKHKVIKIRFTHVQLHQELGYSCTENDDRLTISQSNRPENTICVNQSKLTLTSRADHVTVNMVTSATKSASGFRAFYSIEWPCEGTVFTDDIGQFGSPHFPDNYTAQHHCSWSIIAPPKHRVVITFTSFRLAGRETTKCSRHDDRVTVFDGANQSGKVLAILCGQRQRRTFYSNGSALFVEFLTYGSVGAPGFHAEYRFVPDYLTVSAAATTVTSIATTTQMFALSLRNDDLIKLRGGVIMNEDTSLSDMADTAELGSSVDQDSSGGLLLDASQQTAILVATFGLVAVLLLVLAVVCRRRHRGKKMFPNLERCDNGANIAVISEAPTDRVNRQVMVSRIGRDFHIYESVNETSLFAIPSVHNNCYVRGPVQRTSASSDPVQRTPTSSDPVQRTVASSDPVQRTVASSGPEQRTVASSDPVQRTVASSGPVQRTVASSDPVQRTPTSSSAPTLYASSRTKNKSPPRAEPKVN